MQHDVRALCLQTRAERDASFSTDVAYVDPEQPNNLVKISDSSRADYKARLEAHFAAVAQQCRQVNIPYLAACIEQDIGIVLRDWLRLAERP